jgi:hypothetical protein
MAPTRCTNAADQARKERRRFELRMRPKKVLAERIAARNANQEVKQIINEYKLGDFD